MEFKDNLKEIRSKKALSQDDLAKQLFVSRQTVSRWESGDRSPDLDTLIKLANVLGVSTDELLGAGSFSGEKVSPTGIEEKSAAPVEIPAKKRHLSIGWLILIIIGSLVLVSSLTACGLYFYYARRSHSTQASEGSPTVLKASISGFSSDVTPSLYPDNVYTVSLSASDSSGNSLKVPFSDVQLTYDTEYIQIITAQTSTVSSFDFKPLSSIEGLKIMISYCSVSASVQFNVLKTPIGFYSLTVFYNDQSKTKTYERGTYVSSSTMQSLFFPSGLTSGYIFDGAFYDAEFTTRYGNDGIYMYDNSTAYLKIYDDTEAKGLVSITAYVNTKAYVGYLSKNQSTDLEHILMEIGLYNADGAYLGLYTDELYLNSYDGSALTSNMTFFIPAVATLGLCQFYMVFPSLSACYLVRYDYMASYSSSQTEVTLKSVLPSLLPSVFSQYSLEGIYEDSSFTKEWDFANSSSMIIYKVLYVKVTAK